MLGITDRLAVIRTELANERTLLAYIRTALALTGAGFAVLQFAQGPEWHLVGLALVPAGALALVIGLLRYRHARRVITAVESNAGTMQRGSA